MPGSKVARIAGGIMAAIVLIAVGAGPASAHGSRGGWGGGPMLGVPLQALNLTTDQRTQVMTIMSNARGTAQPLMQQLQQARSSLADALLASPSADVSAQLQTINGLRSQLLQTRAQTTAQVLAVLTPDQLAQAAQIRAQLAQLRSQRRQLLSPAQP